jgi:hypothetical protein
LRSEETGGNPKRSANFFWLRRLLSYPGDKKTGLNDQLISIPRAILRHLGLWEVKARPPPKVKVPSGMIIIVPDANLKSNHYVLYLISKENTRPVADLLLSCRFAL